MYVPPIVGGGGVIIFVEGVYRLVHWHGDLEPRINP